MSAHALAFVSIACVLAGALAVLRLHTLKTGLNPVRDAVSDYGRTAHDGFYRFQVLAFGVGAALLTAALAKLGGVRTSGLVWLGVYAAARMAIAGFMIDRDRAAPTTEGKVHTALATLAFTSIAVAASTVGSDLGGAYGTLGWAVAALAVLTLVFAVVARLRPAFGLVERLLYVASAAWLVAVAAHLLG